ncbi:hypothetical protein B0T26DRAFT_725090 [Lasiosphaeria miniovina]|uniref:Uncharacterized protein n=1 Tax=Lasiosphaeria miniovina TaxID=1954250 RepID=A0AA39ZYJ9_9PEZI|nr:uncharacterized protein B0T26DRAFT_725090 [Lasiosphaeria miniovina]KAK0705968.1 hypothetical protein B0T26DRAFT_725090 [Lasiosphaeria miniovina]
MYVPTCIQVAQCNYDKEVFPRQEMKPYKLVTVNKLLQPTMLDRSARSLARSEILICLTQNPNFIHASVIDRPIDPVRCKHQFSRRSSRHTRMSTDRQTDRHHPTCADTACERLPQNAAGTDTVTVTVTVSDGSSWTPSTAGTVVFTAADVDAVAVHVSAAPLAVASCTRTVSVTVSNTRTVLRCGPSLSAGMLLLVSGVVGGEARSAGSTAGAGSVSSSMAPGCSSS